MILYVFKATKNPKKYGITRDRSGVTLANTKGGWRFYRRVDTNDKETWPWDDEAMNDEAIWPALCEHMIISAKVYLKDFDALVSDFGKIKIKKTKR